MNPEEKLHWEKHFKQNLLKNIIENEDAPKSSRFFHPILTFIEQSIEMYGKNIDDKILLVAIDDKVLSDSCITHSSHIFNYL